jgi:hypothetical protein
MFRLFDGIWQRKEDGSLRNQGVEFVTHPTKVTDAVRALQLLEKTFQVYYTRIQAGPRCGVHIHVNCLDRSYSQVASLIALYLVFEKSLFRFTGNRVNNNFCVPARFSNHELGGVLRAVLKGNDHGFWEAVQRIPKYLAFNAGALARFGTIEFRHAQGTNQPTTIIPWLKTINAMVAYASANDFTTLVNRLTALNSTSEYELLAREVFPPEFLTATPAGFLTADMVQGCSTLKEYLIAPEEVRAAPEPEFDPDDEFRPRGRDNVWVGAQHAAAARLGPAVRVDPAWNIIGDIADLDAPPAARGLLRAGEAAAAPADARRARRAAVRNEHRAGARARVPIRAGSRHEPAVTGETALAFAERVMMETEQGIRRRLTDAGLPHRSQTDPTWGVTSTGGRANDPVQW